MAYLIGNSLFVSPEDEAKLRESLWYDKSRPASALWMFGSMFGGLKVYTSPYLPRPAPVLLRLSLPYSSRRPLWLRVLQLLAREMF